MVLVSMRSVLALLLLHLAYATAMSDGEAALYGVLAVSAGFVFLLLFGVCLFGSATAAARGDPTAATDGKDSEGSLSAAAKSQVTSSARAVWTQYGIQDRSVPPPNYGQR